jgi:hypothetical protein
MPRLFTEVMASLKQSPSAPIASPPTRTYALLKPVFESRPLIQKPRLLERFVKHHG